jgi:hypothetical protein
MGPLLPELHSECVRIHNFTAAAAVTGGIILKASVGAPLFGELQSELVRVHQPGDPLQVHQAATMHLAGAWWQPQHE